MTLNTVLAVLLIAFALFALVRSAQSAWGSLSDRRRAVGWLVLGLAASLQVANLVWRYSWVFSVVTTLGLLLGLWLLFRAPTRVER